MSIIKELYGKMPDGREVYRYTLENKNGMIMKVLNYGGVVTELIVPDKNGKLTDVIGGYDTFESYLGADGFQGTLVGRVANRIANARFELDGKTYQLNPTGDNGHQLHGGLVGFNAKLWDVKEIDGEEPALELHLISPDGDEKYPGTLDITVTYTLSNANGWVIRYLANTDKPTIINLTQHAYFNLSGFNAGSILDTVLKMDADSYIPGDADLIPTGDIKSVEGTPFDFREGKAIGRDLGVEDRDLLLAGGTFNGYDHCFNFVGGESATAVKRIEAYDAKNGMTMEVYTNQPCVQLYTGNFLVNEKYPFKGGYPQKIQTLFCLETQRMPDSINHDNFTNCVLRPGEVYEHITEYRFKAV